MAFFRAQNQLMAMLLVCQAWLTSSLTDLFSVASLVKLERNIQKRKFVVVLYPTFLRFSDNRH